MESTSRSNNKMLSNEKVSANHEQAFFSYDNDYDSSQFRLKLASFARKKKLDFFFIMIGITIEWLVK